MLPQKIYKFRVSEKPSPAVGHQQMKTRENAVIYCSFYPSLVLSVRYRKKGKTVTPSRRLQAKGETCSLQTGKLCYNANLTSLCLCMYRIKSYGVTIQKKSLWQNICDVIFISQDFTKINFDFSSIRIRAANAFSRLVCKKARFYSGKFVIQPRVLIIITLHSADFAGD